MSGPILPTVPTALAAYEARPQNPPSAPADYAIFANGCFWGTQQLYDKADFGSEKAVIKTYVGYIGGNDKFKDPTYRQVCSGSTGFAEACKVEYDPTKVSYAELVEFFYRTHDPTTIDRQGSDRGSQYRSAIFAHNSEQMEIAKKVTAEVDEKYFEPKGQKVVTAIETAPTWYNAEEYHQQYLDNNPDGYHCSTHFLHW